MPIVKMHKDTTRLDKSTVNTYDENMRTIGIFIITLLLYSCNHTDIPLQTERKTGQPDSSATMSEAAQHVPSPAEQETKERYENLDESKRKLLARSIVKSADWEKLYREYNAVMDECSSADEESSEAKMKELRKKREQVNSWLLVTKNPYIRSALKKLRKDKALAPLVGNAQPGKCPIMDHLDIFNIVIKDYINLFPVDKQAWDFLWLMMLTEEEEHPQFRTIKEYIQEEKLTDFPYGKQIYELVKDYRCVADIPSGRRPLDK